MKRVTAISIVSVLILGLSPDALGVRGRIRDGRDGMRRGAIQSVTYNSPYYQTNWIKIKLERPLREYKMTPRDFFAIEIDHHADGRGDTYVFLTNSYGRLTSYADVYYRKQRSGEFGGTPVDMTNPRTIRVRLDDSTVAYGTSDPHSYLFRVYSIFRGENKCGKHCADVAPNRGWVLFDPIDPTLSLDVPARSFNRGEPRIKVGWGAWDDGLSGFKDRTLSMKRPGQRRWRVVGREKTQGYDVYRMPSKEGDRVMFRLTAREDFGGSFSRTYLTEVPWDDLTDRNNATFTGAWLPTLDNDAYRGTLRVSHSRLDTFSFSGRGTAYCFAWRPDAGRALLSGGGKSLVVDMTSVYSGVWMSCLTFDKSRHRTVTVSVREVGVNVDAHWIHTPSRRIESRKTQRRSSEVPATPLTESETLLDLRDKATR